MFLNLPGITFYQMTFEQSLAYKFVSVLLSFFIGMFSLLLVKWLDRKFLSIVVFIKFTLVVAMVASSIKSMILIDLMPILDLIILHELLSI